MQRIALALVVAAMAASPATADVPNQFGSRQDPNQLACKKQAKVGTRLADKICHTRAQWDEITEENKRAATDMVNRAVPKVCGQTINEPC